MKGAYALSPSKRAEYILDGIYEAGISETDAKTYLFSGGLYYECWAEVWSWISEVNFLSCAASATVPIFFLLSDRDSYNTNEKEFTKVATDFKRLMLHGSHYLVWDNPQRVGKEVAKWIVDTFEEAGQEWRALSHKDRTKRKEVTTKMSVPSGRVNLQNNQVGGYGKEEKVVVYRVKATLGGVERSADKRFSEFQSLHKKIDALSKNHPDYPKLGSLPGKKIRMFTDHYSEKFIEERRLALEQYLMILSQLEQSLWLDDFFGFLVGGKETFQGTLQEEETASFPSEVKSEIVGEDEQKANGDANYDAFSAQDPYQYSGQPVGDTTNDFDFGSSIDVIEQ